MRKSREFGLFKDVPDELWNDWHWQVKNRVETVEDLKKYMTLTAEEEEGVAKCLSTLRMAVTPYYLSLIDPTDPEDRFVNRQSRQRKSFIVPLQIWKIRCMRIQILRHRD